MPIDQVVEVGRRLLDLGAYQLSLGDTTGVGHDGPRHRAARRLQRRRGAATTGSRCTSTTPTARRWRTPTPRCAHGVTTFDASAGGLGGCPYAESATGNLATEDLVWMLDGLGVETGVDLAALVGDQPLARRPPRAAQPQPGGQRPGLTPRDVRHNLRMADVVYLHVGAPKTGTTYLQDRLYANRADARRARGAVPGRPPAPTCSRPRSTSSTVRGPASARRSAASGTPLVGRVRRAPGTVLVSHEILASATTDQIDRVMRDLSGAEVHLVYSARDIGRQIPAEWQESLKHRHKRRFRRLPAIGAGGRPARVRRCGSGGCTTFPTCSTVGQRASRRNGCTW